MSSRERSHAPLAFPATPILFRYLTTTEKGNYVYQYASYTQMRAKIKELESELMENGGNAETLHQLNETKKALSDKTWGKNYMEPPEDVIAEKSPYFDPATGRVLVARRLPDDSLRYALYRSVEAVTSDVINSLVWNDRNCRNNPYTPLSIYPMTERNTPCCFYADLEEAFPEPLEDCEVPTDEQLVDPTTCSLEEGEEGHDTRNRNERAILVSEKRSHLLVQARRRFEQTWKDRENAFAERCRWALVLVRQSILSMYGVDMGESPVWWYTACSRFKNSFRVYVPDWVFVDAEQLSKVMKNTLAMLNLLHDKHPCKVALLKGTGTVKDSNPYVIDWSVYNEHRQMRAPFQPKNPTKRNAFVPYDILVLARIPVLDATAAQRWFEPALCVAMRPEQATRSKLKCFPHRLPFSFGDKLTSDLQVAQMGAIERLLKTSSKRYDRPPAFSKLVSAQIVALDANGVSRRTEVYNRLAHLRTYVAANAEWLRHMALPDKAMATHGKRSHLLLAAFLMILAAQIVRYAFTWKRELEEQIIPDMELIDAPQHELFTPAMRLAFVRTVAYYNVFTMVALGRNTAERLSSELEPGPGRFSDGAPDAYLSSHHRNLIMLHTLPPLAAVTRRNAFRSYGALMAFDPGMFSYHERLLLWQPSAAEKVANAPDAKRRQLESFWDVLDNPDADQDGDPSRAMTTTASSPPSAGELSAGSSAASPRATPAGSLRVTPPKPTPDEASRSGEEAPVRKRQAVQDEKSQTYGTRVTAKPIVSRAVVARATPLQRQVANGAGQRSLFSFRDADGRPTTEPSAY